MASTTTSKLPPNRFPSSPAVESVRPTWIQDWLAHLVFALLLGVAVLTLIFVPLRTVSFQANNTLAVPNDFDPRLSRFFQSQGLAVEPHSEWSLLRQLRSGANFVIATETTTNATKAIEPQASFIPLYPKSVVLVSQNPQVSSVYNLQQLLSGKEKVYLDQGVARLELMSALALRTIPGSEGAQTFSSRQASGLLQKLRSRDRLKTGSSPQELEKALAHGYFCLTTDNRSARASSPSQQLYYAKFPTVMFVEGVWSRHPGNPNHDYRLSAPPANLLNPDYYPSLSTSFQKNIKASPIDNLGQFKQFNWEQSLSNDTFGASWEWKNTNESYQIGSFIALLCLLSFWAGWRFWTTISPYVRRAVLIQASLLALWILARIIKHSLPGFYERYAWYYYYVPIYSTLTILFFVIAHSSRRLPPVYRSLRAFIVTLGTALMLMVFTNDFHHLLLRFGRGQSWVDYKYGPGYYLYYLSVLLLFSAILYVALWSFKGNRTRLLAALGVLFAFAVTYSLAYTLRVPLVRATENVQIYCIFFLLAWELLFFIGLIPQNRGYTRFFKKSTLPMEIVDRNWEPRYVTSTPLYLDESVKRHLRETSIPVLLTDNSSSSPRTLYCQAQPINAGHVIWETDISAVQELEKTLAALREREAHQTKVLTSEYEALKQVKQPSQAPLLYDRLDVLMDNALKRVQANSARLDSQLPSNQLAELLRSIKMDLGYAKRAGLLTLSYFENGEVSVNVLTTLLSQSCTDFSYANSLAGLHGPTSGSLHLEEALWCLEGLHRGLGCVVSLSDLAVFINLEAGAIGQPVKMNWILDIPAGQIGLLQPLLDWPQAKVKLILEDGVVNLQMRINRPAQESNSFVTLSEVSKEFTANVSTISNGEQNK
ncbi:histidine kinase N-terminal 7TM domain-containing protein [Varibaculum cambriense]|uniref:histidine kinase N-terminal 7TM domain-containing protein n=1 Tax=Varibaculum cambriense TaxID=184870 RepID=UPI002904DBDF|nr:histidine kinase N-terminal 7TM domain-containing protein [Varibaculum cambriense]MDU1224807.1 histidine kinase N-terminal 7TM domain-containing protein [Varibaculum cambriense]